MHDEINFGALVFGGENVESGSDIVEKDFFNPKDGRGKENFSEAAVMRKSNRKGTVRPTQAFNIYGAMEREHRGINNTMRTLDAEEIDLQMNGTLRAAEDNMEFGRGDT